MSLVNMFESTVVKDFTDCYLNTIFMQNKTVSFVKADEIVLLQNGPGWMERDKNVEKH